MRRNSMENTYLFVDGGYLQRRVQLFEQHFFNTPLSINYEKLGQGAYKSFYYDAYPVKRQDENDSDFNVRYEAAEKRFDEISKNRGWHVNFGLTRGEGKKLRQKGVDIALALDAVAHRSLGNFERVFLIAGDLDFLPLVRALVEAGAWVELWCDPTMTPKELINAADSRRFIEPRSFRDYVIGGALPTNPTSIKAFRGRRTS